MDAEYCVWLRRICAKAVMMYYLNSNAQPSKPESRSEDCLLCFPLEPSQVNTGQKAFLVHSNPWRSGALASATARLTMVTA